MARSDSCWIPSDRDESSGNFVIVALARAWLPRVLPFVPERAVSPAFELD